MAEAFPTVPATRVDPDLTLIRQMAAAPELPGQASGAEAELADLRGALARLPLEQRAALELVFAHGLTMAEAAAVLGVAPGTVKSRLHRAKQALRAILEDEEPTDG